MRDDILPKKKLARDKADLNKNILLHDRQKEMRRQVARLRKFAKKQSEIVAGKINAIADEIESKI